MQINAVLIANGVKDIVVSVIVMSDVAITAKILGSLPSKYNSLITAWDSVDPTQQTLNKLHQRLLKEEARLGTTNEMTNTLATMTLNNKKPQKSAFEQTKKKR